jgi:Rrf2 family protein
VKISRKAEYALRAVVILAAAPEDRPLQIQDLAATGGIPAKFLEQILLTLKRGGLLRSKRGVGGGYQLAKPARAITVGEIIERIDGSLCSLGEIDGETAGYPGARGLQACLKEVDEMVNTHLSKRTIEEVLADESPDSMIAFGI